jgi:hypothetical protein
MDTAMNKALPYSLGVATSDTWAQLRVVAATVVAYPLWCLSGSHGLVRELIHLHILVNSRTLTLYMADALERSFKTNCKKCCDR